MTTELGRVCTLLKGGLDPQKHASSQFAHYSLPAFDLGRGPVIEAGASIHSQKIPIPNDVVLVSKLNPRIPRVWWVNDEQQVQRICSTEFVPLKPDPAVLDSAYLEFALRDALQGGVIKGNTAAATKSRERAKPADFLRLQIKLPSLTEQRRIVDLLSRADSLVRMRRAASRLAKEIIPALFLDMFGDPATNPKGWEANLLGGVVEDVRNGFNPPKEAFGTGLPFVTVNSLYDGLAINLSKAQRVNPAGADINKYLLQRGDICFARSSVKRSGVGMASVFDSDEPAIFGGFVIRVRLKKGMLPSFTCAMMQTASLRAIIVDSAGTGTITNLNQPALLKLPIICPPLEKQRDYQQLLLEMQAISRDQSSAVTLAASALQSMLARVFGEAQ